MTSKGYTPKDSKPQPGAHVRINAALNLAVRYGGIPGDHHKAWVIDQVVRILAADGYDELVKSAKDGEDGPDSYGWEVGIAP